LREREFCEAPAEAHQIVERSVLDNALLFAEQRETTVEKANAPTPARTESESSVRSTLMVTVPQRTVAKVRLESLRKASSPTASWLLPAASTSKRSLPMLKIARLRPEKIADWVMQKAMPTQTKAFEDKGKSVMVKQPFSSIRTVE
jgi:plasmid replication initiation protein